MPNGTAMCQSEESRKGQRAINVAAGPWQAWQGQLDDLTVAGAGPEAHAQYNKHALDLRTAAPPHDWKGQVPFAKQKMTYKMRQNKATLQRIVYKFMSVLFISMSENISFVLSWKN